MTQTPEQKRAWHEKNRDKMNAYHNDYYHNVIKKDPVKRARKLKYGVVARRKKKYGITREQYAELLTKQEGMCIICKEFHGENLRVDHNHQTGQVRALLCNLCNVALGQMKENPVRLRAAADYLEHHNGKKA